MSASLKDVQESFQAYLLSGDDRTMLSLVREGARDRREVMLGVYKHAYRARLREILGNDYPKLQVYLGSDQFDRLANAYIDAHPSRSTSARWVGEVLPNFLMTAAAWSERREFAELAALEHALNAVFDERDEDPLDMECFASIGGNDWPELVFTPMRATRRLTLRTNAADIWIALKDGASPPAPEQRDPGQCIVFRSDYQPRFRVMSGEDAMMWDEMCRGTSFGDLCMMVAAFGGEEGAATRAAGHLGGWIAGGLIASAHIPPR